MSCTTCPPQCKSNNQPNSGTRIAPPDMIKVDPIPKPDPTISSALLSAITGYVITCALVKKPNKKNKVYMVAILILFQYIIPKINASEINPDTIIGILRFCILSDIHPSAGEPSMAPKYKITTINAACVSDKC